MNSGMDGAMEDFSKAIAIDPTYANAYINRGVARVAKGDFSEAIQDFTHAMDHATKRATYSAALSDRAEAKIKNGDADGGMKDFAAIIAADPKNFEPYATRALARCQLRDLKGAEEDMARAMKLNPGAGYCYFVRGALKTANGDLPGAIKDYDTALKLNPKDDMILINRAMGWNSLREWNKSIADCERVLAQKPDPITAAQAHFIMGASIEGRDCDNEKAAVELRKAIALDPRHDLAHWKLGVGKVHMQDQEGAMSEFNKALEINPHNAPALADRGLLKGLQRDFPGALADIGRGTGLLGNLGTAWQMKDELGRIGGAERGEFILEFRVLTHADRLPPLHDQVVTLHPLLEHRGAHLLALVHHVGRVRQGRP
jgi:tetratricopeptide (TPR) repeat protein